MKNFSTKEIWKDIKNYEGIYQVSNLGRVRSINRIVIRKDNVILHLEGKILKQFKRKDGYLQINLINKNKYKHFSVHRLVAQAFIDNYDNLPCINHKDENKENNNVKNLEWCTIKYNNNYKYEIYKMIKIMSRKIFETNTKIKENIFININNENINEIMVQTTYFGNNIIGVI